MDLASIVSHTFAALPTGLAGTATLARSSVDATAVNPLTDSPGAPAVLSVAGIPVVLEVPRPDRVLPPGMVRERARDVTMPAQALGGMVPLDGDTLTVTGGGVWTVVGDVPLDPSGAAPALYTVLVRC